MRSCTEQDPVKALQMLDTFRPTLVMLDIEMPGMNGFDFLNKAGSWDFRCDLHNCL
jgi:two-component system LytT family response regulator